MQSYVIYTVAVMSDLGQSRGVQAPARREDVDPALSLVLPPRPPPRPPRLAAQRGTYRGVQRDPRASGESNQRYIQIF